MKVNKSEGAANDLLDPDSDLWAAAGETITLEPIALDSQPNRYIRGKWKDKAYGTISTAEASAIVSGDTLFVKLAWQDDDTPNLEFADAAAVVTGAGVAETLGTEDEAVNLWYWAGDREESLSVTSSGPGVFRKNSAKSVRAGASLNDGTWQVVLSGPMSDVVGNQIGLALWNGSNEERAGLAAVSGWLPLEQE